MRPPRWLIAVALVLLTCWSLYILGAFGAAIPAVVGVGLALGALALTPFRKVRIAPLVFLLPAIYVIALLVGGDFDLNPCEGVDFERTQSVGAVWRWWPPRDDCRVVWEHNSVATIRNRADGFLTVFALGLGLAGLLLLHERYLARIVAAVAATCVAIVVLFV